MGPVDDYHEYKAPKHQSTKLIESLAHFDEMVILLPHVLGPKFERQQRPRNSQGFRIGRSRGNLARTPDVAVVISLNRLLVPVDDTVTAQLKTQVTSHKSQVHAGPHCRGEKGKP